MCFPQMLGVGAYLPTDRPQVAKFAAAFPPHIQYNAFVQYSRALLFDNPNSLGHPLRDDQPPTRAAVRAAWAVWYRLPNTGV
jgi:hypothetical protein